MHICSHMCQTHKQWDEGLLLVRTNKIGLKIIFRSEFI